MPIRFLGAALGIWMAHKKGRNVVIWGALCFFFPIMTIPLALMPRVIRRDEITRCGKCQSPVLKGSGKCPNCGMDIPIDLIECGSCGKFIPEGEKCPECNSHQ